MQSLDQQLNSLDASNRQRVTEPVDGVCAASQARSSSSQISRLQRQMGYLRNRLRGQCSQRLVLGIGLVSSLAIATPLSLVYLRYSDRNLNNISLLTESVESHSWRGENISFHQLNGNLFDVSFQLSYGLGPNHGASQLALRNIDLTLLIPEAPLTARNNKDLTRWFLTEREFNRQRVVFEPGSAHIDLPIGLEGYSPEDLSISLTNNCLGAGYWEVAVSAVGEDGHLEKIYQGYFTFPRGAYAEMVSQLNPSHYWQQARTMESWPGFRFLAGLPFDLDALRRVDAETTVAVTDLKAEEIIAEKEQISKETLIVYADETTAETMHTWEDLRQADLKFQSFVTPGLYDDTRLWTSDFSQLSAVTGATGRQITSALSDSPLVEVEIKFENEAGELRRLVMSGLDWEAVPQLAPADYSEGAYMPLGFGTPFTQNYDDLVANPPALSPFFSVILDGANQVIDYRKDIGLNGLVLHRDLEDANLLHVYPMSYERITLVGHYIVDLELLI